MIIVYVRANVASSSAIAIVAVMTAGCGRLGYDLSTLGVSGTPGTNGGAAGSTGGGATGGGLDGAIGGGGSDAVSGSGGTPGTSSDASISDARVGSGGSVGAPDAGGTADAANSSGGSTSLEAGPPTTRIVDVTDPTQTLRLGTAQIGNGELDLTPNSRTVVGAAYLPQPYVISPATSFTVSFSFRLHDSVGSPGDGFAFLWQNDPRGAAAMGTAGGDLGYGGITPSVIAEFDITNNSWDPAMNDVAITTNGDYMTSIADQVPSFAMWDGVTHYAWIDYDAATTTLSVYVAETSPLRPSAPLVSAAVDLYATVGSSAYLGFTASCGVANEYAAILSLTVDYRP